jgi:hypothetical protein
MFDNHTIVRDIDKPDVELAMATERETVQPLPEGESQRPIFVRYHSFGSSDDGGRQMKMDLYAFVIPDEQHAVTDSGSITFEDSRPILAREVGRYVCQGPVDKITDLPNERCGKPATEVFMFAHRDGGAVVFGCAAHAISLARWAGRQFGGCWGSEVSKFQATLESAEKSGLPIATPHKNEYSRLTPVPGAPRITPPFGSP